MKEILSAHKMNQWQVGFTCHTAPQHVHQRTSFVSGHVKVKIWLKKIDTVES